MSPNETILPLSPANQSAYVDTQAILLRELAMSSTMYSNFLFLQIQFNSFSRFALKRFNFWKPGVDTCFPSSDFHFAIATVKGISSMFCDDSWVGKGGLPIMSRDK